MQRLGRSGPNTLALREAARSCEPKKGVALLALLALREAFGAAKLRTYAAPTQWLRRQGSRKGSRKVSQGLARVDVSQGSREGLASVEVSQTRYAGGTPGVRGVGSRKGSRKGLARVRSREGLARVKVSQGSREGLAKPSLCTSQISVQEPCPGRGSWTLAACGL